MLLLILTALYPTLIHGLPSDLKSRTIEVSSGIPEDVAIGEFTFGESRLLYTYVNSSNILTIMAVAAVGVFALAIFFYVYDLYITGGGDGFNRNGNINGTDFDYVDPYGYSSSFDATTRIRKRYVKKSVEKYLISSVPLLLYIINQHF